MIKFVQKVAVLNCDCDFYAAVPKSTTRQYPNAETQLLYDSGAERVSTWADMCTHGGGFPIPTHTFLVHMNWIRKSYGLVYP